MLEIFADDGRMSHPWYIKYSLRNSFSASNFFISTPVYRDLLALQKPTPELRPKKAQKTKNLPKQFLPKPAYKGAK